MYRYIKASLSPTIPNWLKSKIDSDRYGSFADRLKDIYNIALDKATFEPGYGRGNSLTIYKLQGDYGQRVYIPRVNDNEELLINGRYRKLGNIASKTLANLAEEVVHVDLNNPDNLAEKRNPYRDPRRTYYHGGKQGAYAGQQYNEYREEWPDRGMTPSNEIRSRDKSGYKVPSPESQLSRYYEKFPDKVTQKVDALYDRILEVKDKVMSPEIINTPYSRDEKMDIGNAIYRVRDAITEYRNLLSMLDKEGNLKKSDDVWVRGSLFKEFSDRVKLISDRLDEAERGLTSRW